MAMSSYNRENPFMYLLETKMEELQFKSEKSVKEMIVMGLIGLISYIILIIRQILYSDLDLTSLIVLPLLVVFCILQVRQSITSIRSEEMNERIFGDAYKNINLNNEELLSNINHYNVAIGRVEYVIEYIFIIDILFSIVLMINIVPILSHIFS